MNPSSPNPEPDWEKLVRHARGDTPPAIDLAALQRVVREAATDVATAGTDTVRSSWAADFIALFATRRATAACFALALVCALVTTWEISDVRDSLPWMELLSTTTGGTP